MQAALWDTLHENIDSLFILCYTVKVIGFGGEFL